MKEQEEQNQQQPLAINQQPTTPPTLPQESNNVFVDNSEGAQQGRALKEMSLNSPQAKEGAQLKASAAKKAAADAPKRKVNKTGIPDRLKASMEALSGLSLDAVRVHYNSDKPALMNAYAYAEGTNVYIAPGQEKHLSHELWHVVQQLRKEVRPTIQLKGKKQGSDSNKLEHHANIKGKEAMNLAKIPDLLPTQKLEEKTSSQEIVQRAAVSTHYGEFSVEDSKYVFINKNKQLQAHITFQPNTEVDATKIGLVQTIKNEVNGLSLIHI